MLHSFFITDGYGEDNMQWWHSGPKGSAHIDFTKSEAINWFTTRVRRIQRTAGIDNFKFDAGESDWMPHVSNNIY